MLPLLNVATTCDRYTEPWSIGDKMIDPCVMLTHVHYLLDYRLDLHWADIVYNYEHGFLEVLGDSSNPVNVQNCTWDRKTISTPHLFRDHHGWIQEIRWHFKCLEGHAPGSNIKNLEVLHPAHLPLVYFSKYPKFNHDLLPPTVTNTSRPIFCQVFIEMPLNASRPSIDLRNSLCRWRLITMNRTKMPGNIFRD